MTLSKKPCHITFARENTVSENKTNQVFVEGTQFYRDRGAGSVARTVIIVLVGLVALSCFAAWAIVDSGARQAYKEARDVRKALRAVGTEYYGGMRSIYDPTRSDGMAPGAAERVAEISTRSGEVTLYTWDDINNIPISFEYQKGLYCVVYTDTGSSADGDLGLEGDFEVYYSFRLLRFEAE